MKDKGTAGQKGWEMEGACQAGKIACTKALEMRDERNRGSERRRPQGALDRQAGVRPSSHGGLGRPLKGSEPCWGRSREPQEGAGENHCPCIAQSWA